MSDLKRETSYSKNKQLKITLPGVAPSVNHMYYNTRSGGKMLTAKALAYSRDARAMVNLAIEEQKWLIQPKGVWLYADFVFYYPDKRIRDNNNQLKLLLDILQGYVYENDYTVLPRVWSVEYDKENPRTEIIISMQTAHHREKSLQLIN